MFTAELYYILRDLSGVIVVNLSSEVK